MARAGKRRGNAARAGKVEVGQRDGVPVARQRTRRRLADAAAGAG